jgi:hypothetical protein
MFTNLSAVKINRLARRPSEAPLGRSASLAAGRLERLLAAKIEADRAPRAIKAILIEAAEWRLAAEIDACEAAAAPPAELATPPVAPEKAAKPAPVVEPAAASSAPASPPVCGH